jgi:SAM-dependent methyltransferase
MGTMDVRERPQIGKVSYNLADKPKNEYPFLLVSHVVRDLLRISPKGVAVDLGCGRGDHVRAFVRLGFDAIGIDRELPPENDLPKHFVCDIAHDRLPLDDNSVDIVFSKSVIEHLYYFELPHYIKEIKRILKPGGAVVIVTPDWYYCYREFFGGFTHCTPYTVESVVDCLNIYEFAKVEGHTLIQLPSVWNSRFMRWLSDVTRVLPLPRSNKWVRWSKERQALAIGRKPQ